MSKEQLEELKLIESKEGFTEIFWKQLSAFRLLRPPTTMEEVYNYLEKAHETAFGVRLFPSYQAFRRWRDRRTKKGTRKI